MTDPHLLAPVVALALWTAVVWAWMYATRIPAMSRAKIDAAKMVGGTGKGLDDVLPQEVQWKAHNYNHLMEQPTLFYAAAVTVALADPGNGAALASAWGYVLLRVAHSLTQTLFNQFMTRFAFFVASSLALIGLIYQAAKAVF